MSGILTRWSNQRWLWQGGTPRNRTGIGGGLRPYAAVELAKKIFGSLQGKNHFRGRRRQDGRSGGQTLAEQRRHEHSGEQSQPTGRAVENWPRRSRYGGALEHLQTTLARRTSSSASTGSPTRSLAKSQVEKALGAAPEPPIFFVDIAVPRDIDPAVNELNNVYVYDSDDLGHASRPTRNNASTKPFGPRTSFRTEVQKTLKRWRRATSCPPSWRLGRPPERNSRRRKWNATRPVRKPDPRAAPDRGRTDARYYEQNPPRTSYRTKERRPVN